MAFEGLSSKLQNVFKKLSGRGKLSEKEVKEAMREVKLALLEADVNFTVVKKFINSVTEYDDEPGYLTIKTAYNLTNLPGKTYRIPISKDKTVFGFDGECTTTPKKP